MKSLEQVAITYAQYLVFRVKWKSNLNLKVKEINLNYMIFDKNFDSQSPFTRIVLELIP